MRFREGLQRRVQAQSDFFAVGGYDGMHLIYEALKKTTGNADGDALIAAAKGMKWESPRGPISIDPETRDIVQNVLHPPGGKGRQQHRQCRVRQGRERQRPDTQVSALRSAIPGWGDRKVVPSLLSSADFRLCLTAKGE
jgi:hypothetical protein